MSKSRTPRTDAAEKRRVNPRWGRTLTEWRLHCVKSESRKLETELAALTQKLDRYRRLSESGESLGGELEEREARMDAESRIAELERQLAEAQEAADAYSKGVYSATMLKAAESIGKDHAQTNEIIALRERLAEAQERRGRMEKFIAAVDCPRVNCQDGVVVNTGPDPVYDPCDWCQGRHDLLYSESATPAPVDCAEPSQEDSGALGAADLDVAEFEFEEHCFDGQKCGAVTTGCFKGKCLRKDLMLTNSITSTPGTFYVINFKGD